ncbi:SIS domain-containing protein [Paenarthrobacter sp. RAF54_2]|uniref:SIS domain-containing protein n=1 Tax=Paenarthrobacter sp. RAF54_2 TaxID=3233061 RepID=UPI003F974AB6
MFEISTSTVDAGASATMREIMQQPQVWQELASIIEAGRNEIDAFLAPLLKLANLRIILTGAGTSAFIGEIAAPALSKSLGRRVEAVATTDLVSNPTQHFAERLPTLLVSFARSGNSPESTAATNLAEEVLGYNLVHHLVVTCDPAGLLASEHRDQPNSLVLLMPSKANDEGFAMTSSFTSMLLAGLLIFDGRNDHAIQALSSAASDVISTRSKEVELLVHRAGNRVIYLGSGPLTGLARESALKLLELTAGHTVTYFDSALGFRHGPKAVIDKDTLVIVFISSDPYTSRYDTDIVSELRTNLGEDHVMTISADPTGAGDGPGWTLEGLSGLNDAYLAVAYAVFAQLFGLNYSLRLGAHPDNPFPDGGVNRVVKGVIIHPLGTSQPSMSEDN